MLHRILYNPNYEVADARVEAGLCAVCRSINFRALASQSNRRIGASDMFVWMPAVGHHEDYENLLRAVANGCRLCAYLREGLLRHTSLSAEEFDEDAFEDDELALGYKIELWRNSTYKITPDVIGFKYARDKGNNPPTEEALHAGIQFTTHAMENPEEIFTLKAPVATFELSIADASPLVAERLFAVRTANSEPDFALAATWLAECIDTHPNCSSAPQSAHPSRLLNVGGDVAGLRPRLVECPDPETKYVALSHCWGLTQPLRTTSSNYASHLSGIALDEFPLTFRDAIDTTRRMGLQYLWIDLLCIIHDSHTDWETESSRMAGIYGNSVLTIAGPAARNSGAGFLARAPQSRTLLDVPCDGLEQALVTIRHADEKTYAEWDWEPDNNLATRGWVLQERILSPRVLYFGSKIMYWECMTCLQREDFHYPVETHSQYGSAVSKIALKSLDDFGVRGYWYDIVRTYSSCLLTFQTDKFPAISGIAHAISDRLPDEYIAGIWKSDIHNGLSWYVEAAEHDPRETAERTIYMAPSWSWGSIPHAIRFNYHRITHTEAIQIQLTMLEEDISTMEAVVEPQGTDTFGALKSAKLRMRFCAKRAFLKAGGGARSVGTRLEVCDAVTRGAVAQFLPDSLEYFDGFHSGREQEVLCLLLGYSQREGEFKFNAMTVEPVSPERLQYRRVGMVQHLVGVSPGDWSQVSRGWGGNDYVALGSQRIDLRSQGLIAPGDWFEDFERLVLELI